VGEVVAERGYPDVTVELIVKRAHVSFKTFYKHYSGKEECFVALFDSALATTEKTIRRRLADEPGPWSDQVVLALRTLVEQIVSEPITERYEQAAKAFVPLFRAGRDLNPRGKDLPGTIEDTLAGSVFWSAYERLIVGAADELVDYLPVLIELVLRTYLGQAEASRIARAEAPAPQPALA
jgi:AcrR family transcriptional regulator